jgi:TRAP-type C4-dicarboxylate transport system permease small subunit
VNTHTPESGDKPPGGNPSPEPQAVPSEPARWGGLVAVLGTIRRVIDKVLAAICIVLFVALVAIVGWQVFTREILNNSAPWTEEAARYTFVVLAIFAAAYVFSERGHIAVEMLILKLPLRLQKVMGVAIELIVIFFIVVVFIRGGWLVANNAWGQDIATLPLSVGQLYLVMPIAGAIIVFYAVAHILGILAGAEKPLPAEDLIEEAI